MALPGRRWSNPLQLQNDQGRSSRIARQPASQPGGVLAALAITDRSMTVAFHSPPPEAGRAYYTPEERLERGAAAWTTPLKPLMSAPVRSKMLT